MNSSLKAACLLVCLTTSLVRADPEVDRLKASYTAALERVDAPLRTAYVKELQRLLEQHIKAGNLDAAMVVKKEIERTTGKPYQGPAMGAAPASPHAELELLFIDKTWRTPTGTKFTFHANGVGDKIFGSDKPEKTSWRHRAPNLVEVTNKDGKGQWFFRFVSLTEGYYGGSKDSTTMKLHPPGEQ